MRKVLILLLLLALASVAAAQDDQNVTVIGSGQTVEGALRDNITAIMYGVNAVEGDVVNVSLSPADDFTPLMVILGPAGQVVATGETQLTAPIEFSGSYFVIVTTFDAIDGAGVQSFDEPLEFALTVSGNNPPAAAGNNLAYFRTDLEYDTTFEGYSSPLEPVYYFIFNGTASAEVNIVATSSDIDPIVFLFDSRGNRIAVNDDADTMILPSTTDAAIESLELPATGLYFVFVTDIGFYEIPELAADEEVDVTDVFEGGDFAITVER